MPHSDLPALPNPEHVVHREPAALAVHPLRRRERRRGRTRVRSRAACVSVIVSAGPSKPTVMRAGNEAGARRRDVDRPRKPACSIARLSSSAVPDGASFFAA